MSTIHFHFNAAVVMPYDFYSILGTVLACIVGLMLFFKIPKPSKIHLPPHGSSLNFAALPVELNRKISEFLSVQSIVSVSASCSDWNRLYNNTAWYQIYTERFDATFSYQTKLELNPFVLADPRHRLERFVLDHFFSRGMLQSLPRYERLSGNTRSSWKSACQARSRGHNVWYCVNCKQLEVFPSCSRWVRCELISNVIDQKPWISYCSCRGMHIRFEDSIEDHSVCMNCGDPHHSSSLQSKS